MSEIRSPLRSGPRPGGRSLRVQEAVHAAVVALIEEFGREGLTVPQVAARAGVTPSTIYRRWSDIATLVSDVAQRNLRIDCPLKPCGRLSDDLPAWAEMYQDEMDSTPGRAMVRDVLRGWDGMQKACPLLDAVRPSIAMICDASSEPVNFDVEAVIDAVVAPLLTRMIFTDAPLASTLARDAAVAFVERHSPNASGSGRGQ
ncbi:TetR/AcrR family transcriptional regulator [Acetobacter sp. DsW_063]|uniref:TetR/AcrR family transcriptional regulator n=1 Tax=Acetobacter sp. DsW_063 TaxID=1514894 RepID=UPI000A360270|nr:TetR/AcrR family transcriptional regulator [Acetobacter sp. DsW_063]OUJ12571.1 TetR family transcriptional regulator [Acetobacter sp. DsW_063]